MMISTKIVFAFKRQNFHMTTDNWFQTVNLTDRKIKFPLFQNDLFVKTYWFITIREKLFNKSRLMRQKRNKQVMSNILLRGFFVECMFVFLIFCKYMLSSVSGVFKINQPFFNYVDSKWSIFHIFFRNLEFDSYNCALQRHHIWNL